MEIVDLIFNLSIALIAVDVSVYAISASLLGSQLKRNILFIQRRLRETENEIKRIQEIASSSRQRLSDIEEELKEFKEEETHFQNVLFCLKAKGAVLYPCALFVFALLSGAVGMILPTYEYLANPVAFLFIFLGSYRIYCTLRSVDFAATNIPLPTFDVSFANGEQSLEIDGSKEQNVMFEIGNAGYDIGEQVEISLFFPPDFKVQKRKGYIMRVQPEDETSTHPLYTGIFYEIDYLHVDTGIGIEVTITAPKAAKTYKIPVYVCERKITEEEFELEIVVK